MQERLILNMTYRMQQKVMLVLVWMAMAWGNAFAQTQLPNGDFENWATPSGAQYEQPTSGWWTSLNALKALGAPVTVEKTTDMHSGSYAAKLTTRTWGTLLLPGLLVSGEFDIQNPRFLVQGQPFTDQPSAFQGWFKYTSVAGDSAGIAALLTRWNAGAGRRDTVAAAAVVVTASQATWTAFDLPFVYSLTGAPDSIIVALVASGDGQNFNGQTGSTLWIDDLQLDYLTAAPAPATPASAPQLRLRAQALDITLPAPASARTLLLRDINGRVLHTQALHAGTQSVDLDLASGVYLVEISGVNVPAFHQKIVYFRP
jgi:Putative carbohydrate metabolism domain